MSDFSAQYKKDVVYDIDDIKEKTSPVLASRDIDRAWVFGSYARGEADVDSDVDILIEGGNMHGLFALGGLYGDLENALEKPIDLIEMAALRQRENPSRRQARLITNIEREKVLIYAK